MALALKCHLAVNFELYIHIAKKSLNDAFEHIKCIYEIAGNTCCNSLEYCFLLLSSSSQSFGGHVNIMMKLLKLHYAWSNNQVFNLNRTFIMAVYLYDKICQHVRVTICELPWINTCNFRIFRPSQNIKYDLNWIFHIAIPVFRIDQSWNYWILRNYCVILKSSTDLDESS